MRAPKQEVMVRREKAGEKAKKRQKKLDQISYEVKDGDIHILSGTYLGRTVRELWQSGPIERDYIVQRLWFTNDRAVVEVINSLCD